MNIILKVLSQLPYIFITYCLTIFNHELFHYLTAKYQKLNPKLSFGIGKNIFTIGDFSFNLNILASQVEIEIEPKNRFNKNIFFLAGMFGNLMFGLIVWFYFPIFYKFALINFIAFIENVILISPLVDMWKVLELDRVFGFLDENNGKLIWCGIAYFIMIITMILSYWIVFFMI